MEYTAKLPTEVGLYRHRWDFRGQMREQVLFVGYTQNKKAEETRKKLSNLLDETRDMVLRHTEGG